MIVWKVSYHDPDYGSRLAWAGTEQEARDVLAERIKQLREVYGEEENGKPCDIDEVEIPTARKADLVRWLNLYFVSDNE